MAGIPLESMVSKARVAANMQVGGPWDEGDWDAGINDAVTAFYMDCIEVLPSFRVRTTPLVITDTATPYAPLPADFLAVFKVTKDARTAQRLVIERSTDELGVRTFRIEDVNLWIDPYELSVGDYELKYNPLPTALTPSVNLDAELAPHREYFELHCAIKCLSSEQSSTSDLDKLFKPCKERAQAWARLQRGAVPSRPRDVRPRGYRLGR